MDENTVFLDYGIINTSIPNTYDKSYYDKTASEYHSMYKTIMPERKDASILDIGCGKGFFLYYLKKEEYTDFIGIDADETSIDHTKKYVTQNCEVAIAKDFLSDKMDTYDLIVMNEVLEHIPKEQIVPLIASIWKSLRLGGVFLCYVPNMENPFTNYTRYHDFTHTIGFTQNSLKMVLKAGGFEDTEILAPQNFRKGIKKFIKRRFN